MVDFICSSAVNIIGVTLSVMLLTWAGVAVWSQFGPSRITCKQWAKFLSAVGLIVASAWLATQYAILGSLTNTLVSVVIMAALGGYGVKIRRANANVRYRVGKVLETGDGGSDYYSTLLRVQITPFLTRPWDHFRKPFPADELTVPHAGLNAGSCRMNIRPVSNVEKGVRVFDIGNTDQTPNDNAHYRLRDLMEKIDSRIIEDCIVNNRNYSDLDKETKDGINRKEFYECMGLRIFEKDGLKMQ